MKPHPAFLVIASLTCAPPAGKTQQSCAQCYTPNSKTAQGTRWSVSSYYGYAYDFVQQLLISPGSALDNGALIAEAENETGTDTCYVDGFAYGPYTSVTPTVGWTVGYADPSTPDGSVAVIGSNQWGPDVVGFSSTVAKYYQVNDGKLGKLPCGTHWYQNLKLQCSGSEPITLTTT